MSTRKLLMVLLALGLVAVACFQASPAWATAAPLTRSAEAAPAYTLSAGRLIYLIDGFEVSELPLGKDSYGNGVGFVAWGDSNNTTLATAAAGDSLAIPGTTGPNTLLQVDYNIGSGGWGGFTHAFENAAKDTWVSQDWSNYEGVGFWLYGTGSGGEINIDIFDNRTTTGDSCERFTYIFKDDFTGWKHFSVPFSAFGRKGWQPGGAPNDGLTLSEVWGYAFGFPAAVGAHTNYIDEVGLLVRQTTVDGFEVSDLPLGKDSYGNGVGFVTWGDTNNTTLATAAVAAGDPLALPGATEPNTLLRVDYNIGSGGWGGFTHAFENAAKDTWVSQDWSSYEGVSFWLYGTGSGGEINIDIFDNRTTTGDSCERFTYIFKDDFSGWKHFSVPFSAFGRKGWQPGGAPNDGLTLSEVWGYAFGFPAAVGARTNYIDEVTLYGKVGGVAAPVVQFSAFEYNAPEGQAATITVSLKGMTADMVKVDYTVEPGTAAPDRDYTPASGTLTFAPGSDSQSVSVNTLDDNKYEGKETVILKLANPQNAALGVRKEAVLNIIDNDPFDVALIDDFETLPTLLKGSENVTLATTGIAASSAQALPGQGQYENVLNVGYQIPAGQSGGLERLFPSGMDWSRAGGLSFWYYGNQTGNTMSVKILDNPASDPEAEGWKLVWSDEFDGTAGTAPDTTKWTHEIGGGGWGNNEREYYTDRTENSALDGNGSLVITASQEDPATTPYECHYGPCEYTSARLVTRNKFEFTYGRAQARLKVPFGQGIWPAFWMLGNDIGTTGWPGCGEIDIMENIGKEPATVHGTVHGPGYSGGNGIGGGYSLSSGRFADDYHIFAVEWEPEEIRWYVDGNLYRTVRPSDLPAGTQWVFDHPFFFILNVAVGGYWPGYPDATSVFPQKMAVDYVRVYQAPDTAERFEAKLKDNFTGWQYITIPFKDFRRSAAQPAGAPDDGLTLTNVRGYGLEMVGGASGSFYLDQVGLASPKLPPMLDDFEAGLSPEYVAWGDFEWNPNTTTALKLSLKQAVLGDPLALPEQEATNAVLAVDCKVAPSGYAGFSRAFANSQGWSEYTTLNFWLYGSNTGGELYLDIFDNRGPNAQGDSAERFTYLFRDDFDGWRHFSVPFSAFARKGWQPAGAPDDGLTLTEVWGYAFGFPAGYSGTTYQDEVKLGKQ